MEGKLKILYAELKDIFSSGFEIIKASLGIPPQGDILNFTLKLAQNLNSFEEIKHWFQSHSKSVSIKF